MKATINLSSKDLETLIWDYLNKRGFSPKHVSFVLREDGFRSGDTYKVFSHASVEIELPDMPMPTGLTT